MNSFYIIRDSWGNVNIFLGVGIGAVSVTVRQWDSETVGTRDWGFGNGEWGMGDALRKW